MISRRSGLSRYSKEGRGSEPLGECRIHHHFIGTINTRKQEAPIERAAPKGVMFSRCFWSGWMILGLGMANSTTSHLLGSRTLSICRQLGPLDEL